MTSWPSISEHLGRGRSHLAIVVDKEDDRPSGVGCSGIGARRGRFSRKPLIPEMSLSLARGRYTLTVVPVPGHVSILTPASQLLYDAKHLRQPEAGSFADLLRREERVEHLVKNFDRDSRAGVRDRTHDVITGWRLLGVLGRADLTSAVPIVMVPPPGIASRALIARFKNDELNLARIGERQREAIRANRLRSVGRADGALEQSAHSGDKPIEIDRVPGPWAAAARRRGVA